jgi:hypothetical protein
LELDDGLFGEITASGEADGDIGVSSKFGWFGWYFGPDFGTALLAATAVAASKALILDWTSVDRTIWDYDSGAGLWPCCRLRSRLRSQDDSIRRCPDLVPIKRFTVPLLCLGDRDLHWQG